MSADSVSADLVSADFLTRVRQYTSYFKCVAVFKFFQMCGVIQVISSLSGYLNFCKRTALSRGFQVCRGTNIFENGRDILFLPSMAKYLERISI